MLISHKHKFVFISIPKTGSTSVRNSLSQYGDVFSSSDTKSPLYLHIKAKDLKKYFIENKWNWNEYYKFAFVRNPWDSIISQYYYKLNFINREKLDLPYNKNFMINCKLLKRKCKNFHEAVQLNLLTFENQVSWTIDDEGKNLINFIGRFENINQDFETICQQIGLPETKLKHQNKTEHLNYCEYYDEKSIEIVRKNLKEDIEAFNYAF
jgi:hypothetical protein